MFQGLFPVPEKSDNLHILQATMTDHGKRIRQPQNAIF